MSGYYKDEKTQGDVNVDGATLEMSGYYKIKSLLL